MPDRENDDQWEVSPDAADKITQDERLQRAEAKLRSLGYRPDERGNWKAEPITITGSMFMTTRGAK